MLGGGPGFSLTPDGALNRQFWLGPASSSRSPSVGRLSAFVVDGRRCCQVLVCFAARLGPASSRPGVRLSLVVVRRCTFSVSCLSYPLGVHCSLFVVRRGCSALLVVQAFAFRWSSFGVIPSPCRVCPILSVFIVRCSSFGVVARRCSSSRRLFIVRRSAWLLGVARS